jgi:ankyrin repeat protein
MNPDPTRQHDITPIQSKRALARQGNSLVSRGLTEITQLVQTSESEALSLVDDIHAAVAAGNLAAVYRILDSHPENVNLQDSDGWTPLHVAVCNDQRSILKLLLERGCDTQQRIKEGHERVVEAAGGRFFEQDQFFMHEPNFSGASPLHLATLLGRTQCAELLLSAGADVHVRDDFEESCLHYVYRAGYYDLRAVPKQCVVRIAEKLLAFGVDVNAQNDNGTTPLHLAVRYNELGLVNWLLGNGADVNLRDYDRCTPLHMATSTAIVDLLLHYNADVDAIGSFELEFRTSGTPLLLAAYRADHDSTRLLLAHGATVDVGSLYWAARNGDEQTVKLLLQHGAEVNGTYIFGYTALHAAASGYDQYEPAYAEQVTRTVELLLSNGANVNAPGDHGITPLDCLRDDSRNDNRIRAILVAHGAKHSPLFRKAHSARN